MSKLNLLRGAVLAAILGASSAASAAWTFTSSTTVNSNVSGDPSMTVGAFYNNGSGNWTSTSFTLYAGNGIGISSDGSGVPNHAIDNNGNVEAVLLTFSSSVILTSVGIGYYNDDSDISVLRYTGANAPGLAGTGSSLSAMNTAGWAVVGNYANLNVDTNAPYNPINPSNLASRYWLITAYDSRYGSGSKLDNGDDYFKLYAVDGRRSTVPEPASIALMSLVGLGLFASRRRKAA